MLNLAVNSQAVIVRGPHRDGAPQQLLELLQTRTDAVSERFSETFTIGSATGPPNPR